MKKFDFLIAADHPSLAGHFPGTPVVPGVVILDEILAITQGAFPAFHIQGLRDAKFHQPLPQGETCRLEIADPTQAHLRFSGYYQDDLIIEGTLIIVESQDRA